MPPLHRDGTALHYEERGAGDPALVLIHGWGGDHSHFAPQIAHFGRSHRVIAPDLRGFGQSDAPEQRYTISDYADEVAWLCDQLGVGAAVFAGHSMGGMIVLALAARYPQLVMGAAILDAPIVSPPPLLDSFRQLSAAIDGPAYEQVLRGFLEQVGGFALDPAGKAELVDQMAASPMHVMRSALRDVGEADSAAAAARCTAPLLYISSGPWYTDVDRLRALCPQLLTAQTVGSGHYLTLEVPGQVNAILDRFLELLAAAPQITP